MHFFRERNWTGQTISLDRSFSQWPNFQLTNTECGRSSCQEKNPYTQDLCFKCHTKPKGVLCFLKHSSFFTPELYKIIWSICSALKFSCDQNCFCFCKERSDDFQLIILKCTGSAKQIVTEVEAVIDYMKILWKWERKLDQNASNSSLGFLNFSKEKSQAAFCHAGPTSRNLKSESKLSSGLEDVAEPGHLCKLDLENTTLERILPFHSWTSWTNHSTHFLKYSWGRVLKKCCLLKRRKIKYMVFSSVYS